MNILLNLATLKAGGGQNVGLNFLSSLSKIKQPNTYFHFIVARNSAIHQYIENNKLGNYTIAPNNAIKRIFFEILFGSQIIRKNKIDIIYSYFGFGLFMKKIPQVIGSADSNLYFPEIDFWEEYKGLAWIKRKLVDKFRIWGLKRATAVIFENGLMEKNGKTLFNLEETRLIKPSIKKFLSTQNSLQLNLSSNRSTGLFLCSWQRNKNFMIIPTLADRLKKQGVQYHFIITAPIDNSEDHQNFIAEIEKYNVQEMISIIGQVNKEQLPELFELTDHIFLLSKLESFSNNIIEAWYYKKILIVSDEPWARSVCKDSALFVKRNSITDISENIISLINDKELNERIIREGTKELLTYPTIKERTKQELEFLEYIHEKY